VSKQGFYIEIIGEHEQLVFPGHSSPKKFHGYMVI